MIKDKKIEITQEELQAILEYNPETGVFRWKASESSKVKIGDIAGSINKISGYCQIRYRKHLYYSHRLAWLYLYGSIPSGKLIDHIDGNKSNNEKSNLRLCSKSQNAMNSGVSKRNTSGFKGVYWNNLRKKWLVQPWLNGVSYFLGYYTEKKEAVKVYQEFCKQRHGEFYRDTTGASQ